MSALDARDPTADVQTTRPDAGQREIDTETGKTAA